MLSGAIRAIMVILMRRVAILTLDGFNEIDSFVALNILNRADGVSAYLASPNASATSLNGVRVETQYELDRLAEADAIIIGSGSRSAEFAANREFLDSLEIAGSDQLIGSQCSGALILAEKGFLSNMEVSTDAVTRPKLALKGLRLSDRSFSRTGKVATAGGCLSAVYLSAWILSELVGGSQAIGALQRVAPVGEIDSFVANTMKVIAPDQSR